MRLTDELKMVIGIVGVSVVLLCIGGYVVLRPAPMYARSDLIRQDTVMRGSRDAKVYLVEFSDFQCPACKAYEPIIEEMLQTYGDTVLFAYRHFPLPQHPYAIDTALAFEAAHEQGKGWEMYHYLFFNQASLSKEIIHKGVDALSINVEQFERAITSQAYKEKINRDVAEGKRLGVHATPTFFLNGQKLNLFTTDDLRTAVAQALEKN